MINHLGWRAIFVNAWMLSRGQRQHYVKITDLRSWTNSHGDSGFEIGKQSMTITNNKLPINLDDLLRQRMAERDRIEYKAGWNPDAVIRTLCAFASDFENLAAAHPQLSHSQYFVIAIHYNSRLFDGGAVCHHTACYPNNRQTGFAREVLKCRSISN